MTNFNTYEYMFSYNGVSLCNCGHDFDEFSCSEFFGECDNQSEILFCWWTEKVRNFFDASLHSQNTKNIQRKEET